jgi:hypothetical protein
MQRQVGSTLSSLGLNPREDVRTDAGYKLDYVVDWCGQKLAIEVDGPPQFVRRKPSGARLLKRRQLRHLGWRLVSIPYWEWDELAKQPSAARTDRQRLGTLGAPMMTLAERPMAYIERAIARANSSDSGAGSLARAASR